MSSQKVARDAFMKTIGQVAASKAMEPIVQMATDTLGAYFGFTYSPAKDWLISNIDPDLSTIDKSYDYTKDMEGWEDWDEYLRNANNQTHMDFLKKT